MDDRLQQIARYFMALKDAAAIDPLEIDRRLLPHIFVLVVESGTPLRLRVRLAGTALDQALGRALAGHTMDEFLHGPRSADVLAGFHRCAEAHEAIWMRQVVGIQDRAPRFVEGVAVYLRPDRVCGGLYLGEISLADTQSSFEIAAIPRA